MLKHIQRTAVATAFAAAADGRHAEAAAIAGSLAQQAFQQQRPDIALGPRQLAIKRGFSGIAAAQGNLGIRQGQPREIIRWCG